MSTPLSPISMDTPHSAGPPIAVTDRALREIVKIFESEDVNSDFGLRVSVANGGCSGFSYEMDFASREPGDMVVDLEAFKVYLDAGSTVFLRGTTIDYEGGLKGKGFVFSNPNASRTCSCGDSFGM